MLTEVGWIVTSLEGGWTGPQEARGRAAESAGAVKRWCQDCIYPVVDPGGAPMLDAFIIEEIKKREREHDSQRPRVELPLPEPTPQRQNDRHEDDEQPERAVLIIDSSAPASPSPRWRGPPTGCRGWA